MRVYVLIPFYNEAPNIPELARSLQDALAGRDHFFVLVDDGSTDGTPDSLRSHFPAERSAILVKPVNKGPGDSFRQGFQWILARSADPSDAVVTMEADNTSDPALLRDMLAVSSLGYDLVLASVYAQGGGFDRTTALRRLLSFAANIALRSLFGVKVLTLSSFYRVYHVELLRRVQAADPELVREPGFICKVELLLKAIEAGARIVELPMTLRSGRRKGRSKMKLLRTAWAYLRFLFSRLAARPRSA